jgi:acyl-CoA reductase-like NAD-dependent aldehyde dehydrogenase
MSDQVMGKEKGLFEAYSQMPIGGVWRRGSSDTSCRVVNPYNDEVLVDIQLANIQDIDEAYKSAKEVQKEWAQTSPFARAKIMERAARLFDERREEIIKIIVQETGGFPPKAMREVEQSIEHTKEASTFPMRMSGLIHPSHIPGKESRVYRLPAGVVTVITPWNFPMFLSVRAVAPALATGNGVVLKPDLNTPISGGLLIAKIFEEAGIPKGLLNVVVADIEEVGDEFIEHPIPRVISFTGSIQAGRRIGEVAGRNLKKVSLELGGNSPFVVLDDADVDQAVSAAVFGKYMHQGQVCMAINRMIVDRSVYDEFVVKLKEKVLNLKVGNPAEGAVIGPLINDTQVTRLKKLIEKSIEEGAEPILLGKIEGRLVEPSILINVHNDMAVAQNELFGPVAVVIPVDGEDEAIQVANDTESGLSAAVFSGSLQRGIQAAKRIQSGMVHVNDQPINDEALCAFGGEKASGIGRHNGEWALEEFTTTQWLSVQEKPRKYPFS